MMRAWLSPVGLAAVLFAGIVVGHILSGGAQGLVHALIGLVSIGCCLMVAWLDAQDSCRGWWKLKGGFWWRAP